MVRVTDARYVWDYVIWVRFADGVEGEVDLRDGRTVAVPLAWFPRLLRATPKQRGDWELIGDGVGIHWEPIDEDIAAGEPRATSQAPGEGASPRAAEAAELVALA